MAVLFLGTRETRSDAAPRDVCRRVLDPTLFHRDPVVELLRQLWKMYLETALPA